MWAPRRVTTPCAFMAYYNSSKANYKVSTSNKGNRLANTHTNGRQNKEMCHLDTNNNSISIIAPAIMREEKILLLLLLLLLLLNRSGFDPRSGLR
jgi:hypothetical protein